VPLQPDTQPTGGIWARVAAFVIDMVVVGLLAYLIGYFVAYFGARTFADASTATKVAGGLLTFIVVDALYFLVGWEATGTTIGMSFFSLEVATQADRKPKLPALVARYVIFLLLRLLGVVPALVSFVLA